MTVTNSLLKFNAEEIKSIRNSTNQISNSFKDLREKSKSLAKSLNSLVEPIKKVSLAISDSFDKQLSILNISKSIDMNIKELQEWAYVAGLSNLKVEDLSKSLQELELDLFYAQKYGGYFKDVLNDVLGISIDKTNGELKTTEEILYELADALKEIPSSSQKYSLGKTLFGTNNPNEMINILSQGSEKIKEIKKEANSFGIIRSNDTITQVGKLNEELTKLSLIFSSLAADALEVLLPYIEDIVVALKDWIVANRGILKQQIQEFFTKVGEALILMKPILLWMVENWQLLVYSFMAFKALQFGFFLFQIAKSLFSIGMAIGSIFKMLGGKGSKGLINFLKKIPFKTIFSSVAKNLAKFFTQPFFKVLYQLLLNGIRFIGGFLLRILITSVGWILKGLLSSIMAHPFIAAIVALVAGIGYLVYKNWDSIKQYSSDALDWLGNTWTNVMDSLSETMSGWTDNVLSGFRKVKSYLSDLNQNMGNPVGKVSEALSDANQKMGDPIGKVKKGASKVLEIGSNVFEDLNNLTNGYLKNSLQMLGQMATFGFYSPNNSHSVPLSVGSSIAPSSYNSDHSSSSSSNTTINISNSVHANNIDVMENVQRNQNLAAFRSY